MFNFILAFLSIWTIVSGLKYSCHPFEKNPTRLRKFTALKFPTVQVLTPKDSTVFDTSKYNLKDQNHHISQCVYSFNF